MHRSRIRLLRLQLGSATHLDVTGTIDFRSSHEAHDEVVAEDDEEGAEDADGDAADEGGLLDGHDFRSTLGKIFGIEAAAGWGSFGCMMWVLISGDVVLKSCRPE